MKRKPAKTLIAIVIILLGLLVAYLLGESATSTPAVTTPPIATNDSSRQLKLNEIDRIDTQIQAELQIIDKINSDKQVCITTASNALNSGQQTLDQYKARLSVLTFCSTNANTQTQSVMDELDSLKQQRATIVSGL